MSRGTNSAKRQQWVERLERFQKSGQTVKAFCQAERVSTPSFYHWKRKLGETTGRGRARPTSKRAPSTAFKAVRVVPSPAAHGVTVRLGTGIVMDLGQDAETIERVVGQLLRHQGLGEIRPC